MTRPYLFRIASHRRHGGGHVSRSMVLARALAETAPTLMVLEPDSDPARLQLEAAGLACATAGSEGSGPWAGVIVDGYGFRDRAPHEIARGARPMIWIDDFLDPPVWADLVVNGACQLSGSEVNGVPALLGPCYALVDPRYATLPARDHGAPVKDVLVSFGRVDPHATTSLVLDALDRLAEEGFTPGISVVTDPAWPHFASLAARAEQSAGRMNLLVDADMAPLLARADLVIGAAGVSLMERMAAGVPSLTIAIAENQRLFVEGAAATGATVDAGMAGNLSAKSVADHVRRLATEPGRRIALAEAGRRLIDGRGARRVADAILAFAAHRETAVGHG